MDVVEAARTMLGTKFRHQARCPGVGVDCVGLAYLAGRMAGFDLPEIPSDYPLVATDDRLIRELDKHLVRIDVQTIDQAKPGSILVFAFASRAVKGSLIVYPQHVRIRTDIGFIHAWTGCGKVAEHHVDAAWRKRFVAAYDFPGIVEEAA